ncbi:sodium:proton antiporter NhaD [Desulfuromonas sp. CSMB_57]|jgi:NhaD family Na+/H+ antiporter|uniref:sodium:proton antiporter NhaD n=1 Tax=Desulfuromonas sp. CSMB_57 TaxID=2807629 RepID=UPI001CD691B3|nr:sodium:proton antiporter NhaD [Desulfuromonas sp. CSMB_57]
MASAFFATVSLLTFLLVAAPANAYEAGATLPDLTGSPFGFAGLVLFAGAYLLVILEEKLHLRKSKPVIVAAGLIWILIAIAYRPLGQAELAHRAILANLTEYGELFLFLLSAMTYINAMEERNVFQALRSWLMCRGFSLRAVFWLTGLLSFFISAVADNLTTALLMGTVVLTVGGRNRKFVVPACINIVVAANAGGAFCPFGDITTLMVWQRGVLHFFQFFHLFLPSLVNWLLPAIFMSLAIPKDRAGSACEVVAMKLGARRIMALFLLTIATAVGFHNFLELPPAVGMMLGLGYLSFFGYYLKRKENRDYAGGPLDETGTNGRPGFDLFRKIARAEWDTLLFFYGVILCVGGLGQLGYLALASNFLYQDLGPTAANILIGLLSAIVDNIPVMYAVLTMQPPMSEGQWLLVTLTAGVGGSLLSIGSAAGVALMGSGRGVYTFSSHLRWTWAVALGYAAAILMHLMLNASLFNHLP